jgi:hypothetical protein
MSDQILTEYELSRAEELLPIYFQDPSALSAIRELIASHRNLLSANAELSFKNQKYKNLVEAVLKSHRERGAIMSEACGDREVVSLAYELEELK